jgi:hypothetical protein
VAGYIQKDRAAFRRLMDMFPRKIRPNAWAVCDEWMMGANFEDSIKEGHELKRGDFVFGRDNTALLTGVGVSQIRTIIRYLKKFGEVTIKATNRGSIGHWCNFDHFVHPPTVNNQQSSQQVTSKEPATNHSEEQKSGKAEESCNGYALQKKQPSEASSTGIEGTEYRSGENEWWETEVGKRIEEELRDFDYDLDGQFGKTPAHKANISKKNRSIVFKYVSDHGSDVFHYIIREAEKRQPQSPGAWLRQVMLEGPRDDEVYKSQFSVVGNDYSEAEDTTIDDDLPF